MSRRVGDRRRGSRIDVGRRDDNNNNNNNNNKSNDNDDDGDDDDKDKKLIDYYVALDLQYFKPEDITVKVSGDIVIVEGKRLQKGKYAIILNTNILELFSCNNSDEWIKIASSNCKLLLKK